MPVMCKERMIRGKELRLAVILSVDVILGNKNLPGPINKLVIAF